MTYNLNPSVFLLNRFFDNLESMILSITPSFNLPSVMSFIISSTFNFENLRLIISILIGSLFNEYREFIILSNTGDLPLLIFLTIFINKFSS